MGLHRTTIRPTSDKALKRSLSRGTESSNPAAHPDLNDLPRDLGDNAHHKGPHAGVAGVWRQPVGNQRPAEQQDADDDDDQCPAPQRVGALGRRRRRDDLLGLSNLRFVHAEYSWLTPVPRWARDLARIRPMKPRFSALWRQFSAKIQGLAGDRMGHRWGT